MSYFPKSKQIIISIKIAWDTFLNKDSWDTQNGNTGKNVHSKIKQLINGKNYVNCSKMES